MSGLKQEYTKAEVEAYDEAFQQLKQTPGWTLILELVGAMRDQVVHVGLGAYKDPPEIAFNAGYEHGLQVLLELPAAFEAKAKQLREADEKEMLGEEERLNRLIRRATTEGEVAL